MSTAVEPSHIGVGWWAAGDLNSGPLIKSQVQRGPEPNIDKKPQPFRGSLAFSSTMEGVCSAQVQAQNKHSRERSPMERPHFVDGLCRYQYRERQIYDDEKG
jgi:hypothetical protein